MILGMPILGLHLDLHQLEIEATPRTYTLAWRRYSLTCLLNLRRPFRHPKPPLLNSWFCDPQWASDC